MNLLLLFIELLYCICIRSV